MKLSKAKLKEILKEEFSNVFEEDEFTSDEPTGAVETEADTLLAQLEELAATVGHVKLSEENPVVWKELQNYVTDLSHRLRGR